MRVVVPRSGEVSWCSIGNPFNLMSQSFAAYVESAGEGEDKQVEAKGGGVRSQIGAAP